MFSLRLEGFSCNLGVLDGALGKSNCNFFYQKYEFFPAVNFSVFGHQNPGSETKSGFGSAFRNWKKCWIRIKSMLIRTLVLSYTFLLIYIYNNLHAYKKFANNAKNPMAISL